MGIVTSEINVIAAPLKTFHIAKEVEKYPEFMPDVEVAEVLERNDDGYSKVAWVGHAKIASIDKLVKWTENEWWDESSLTSKFDQIEGDYRHYRGNWEFIPTESGTKIRMTVDFDLGLPLIGPMIVRLLDKIMQNNIDGMLKAIKERAENS